MTNKERLKKAIDKEINKDYNYNKIIEKISELKSTKKEKIIWKLSFVSINVIIIIIFLLVLNFRNSKIYNSNITKDNTNSTEYLTYEIYNYLSSDIIDSAKDITPNALLVHEYTPEYMLEKSDAVAIISIASVDDANTDLDIVVGNTYGTFIVNNVIYGNISNNKLLKYIKSGGIMTLEEYEKNQPESVKEKDKKLQEESGLDASQIYVNMHYLNDPIIEEGKVYLAYLKYHEKYDSYEIIGLGNGFRELNINKAKTITNEQISLNNMTIKNNNTGEFESLTNYINNYIK